MFTDCSSDLIWVLMRLEKLDSHKQIVANGNKTEKKTCLEMSGFSLLKISQGVSSLVR